MLEKAIFAAGCFWGVEYYLQQVKGVISTLVGYTGGHKDSPNYKEVCSNITCHVEAVEVVFDPEIVSYEELVKIFLEIHDPTHVNRQGPDISEQYRSEIFYLNEKQKVIAEKLIKILKDKKIKVVTRVTKATFFWEAEKCHHNYYNKTGDTPYCHMYTRRF